MSSLEDVREGMDVVDATGQEVGTVRFVKMGDPEATTAEGQTAGEPHGLIDTLAGAFTGDKDVPDEMKERYLRLGYIDIDGTGIGGDFTVAADAVARVEGGRVHLNTQRADS